MAVSPRQSTPSGTQDSLEHSRLPVSCGVISSRSADASVVPGSLHSRFSVSCGVISSRCAEASVIPGPLYYRPSHGRHSDTESDSTWEVDTLSSGGEDPTAWRLNSAGQYTGDPSTPKHCVMSSLTPDALWLNADDSSMPKHCDMASLTSDAKGFATVVNSTESSQTSNSGGVMSTLTAGAKGPVPVVAETRPEDPLWLSALRPEASCLRPVPEFIGGMGVLASSDTDNFMLNSNHGVDDHSTGIYESGG